MEIIEFVSYIILPLFILIIVFHGEKKLHASYDTFIEGAKESTSIILKIFPTMLCVVTAINLLKVSGTMDIFVKLVTPIFNVLKVPKEVVPLGIMRSVSGSGALAVLTDTLKEHGPDSLVGRIASTIMGASDTTLYVLAVYTTSVGIKKTKWALVIGLLCDFIAFMIAVFLWTKI